MIENLTPAQQIFSVFYAIFFGIMLQTVGARRSNPRIDDIKRKASKKTEKLEKNITLNLFDTPDAWAIGNFSPDNKPLWRFLFSLLMLNIFPGLVFALVFVSLGHIKDSLNVLQILVLVWISLVPNNIYRIYLGILTECIDALYLDERSKYKEFGVPDLNARAILVNERKQYPGHNKLLNHIAIPVFWFFPATTLFYYYVFSPASHYQLNTCFIGLVWGLLISSVAFFYFSKV